MAFFDLLITTAASRHPDGEPSDFVSEYTGTIRCTRDHGGRAVRVGRVRAYRVRREKTQTEYVEDFFWAVVTFLAFHHDHADLAARLARAVAAHATPVGSGTVARTKRIPVEQRAEAAVIAWMRHATTGYDSMAIPRVKGRRREVRRMLARRSHELLDRYRRGEPAPGECPFQKALAAAKTGAA